MKAGGEEDNRGQSGWMASPTQWTRAWASSKRWWRTGKPSVLQSMWLQGSDTAEWLNKNNPCFQNFRICALSTPHPISTPFKIHKLGALIPACIIISSVQSLRRVWVLRLHGLQHTRLSLSLGYYHHTSLFV